MTPSPLGFHRFTPPASPPLPLPSPPQLASWDAAGSASQLRLTRFLDDFAATIADAGVPSGPLAVHLHVALDPSVPLLHDRDLDNYLTPIMTRLRDRQVVSVWGSKSYGAQSTVQIERAVVATDDLAGWSFAQVRPMGSASSAGWKVSLRDQIAAQASPAPPGATVGAPGSRCAGACPRHDSCWQATSSPACHSTGDLGAARGNTRMDARGGEPQ